MKSAIIGTGAVGKALMKCYKKSKLPITAKDINNKQLKNIDFLNICIPFNEKFVSTIVDYSKSIKPQCIIIHSTVECGTAEKIQQKTKIPVVSSPVRGTHDNLYKSLKTFIKYIGCSDMSIAMQVQKHYRKLGIQSKIMPCTRTVELAKLLCTSYYGLCIKWHDIIYQSSRKANINYHDILDWNASYNAGYFKLGQKQFLRPILFPPKGKIGGTCILPNLKLLKTLYSHPIIDSLLE